LFISGGRHLTYDGEWNLFFLEHARELFIISLREKRRNSTKEGEEPPSPRETLDQSN
jgi:hypothetical protein